MHIEFLGTAGYHPCEIRHTSCIYLPDATPRSAFLLDAGTGAFRLVGRDLPPRLHIWMSHAHLDHSVGLTFLLDILFGKTCDVTIYGTVPTLKAISQTIFAQPLFPVELRYQTCEIVPGESMEVDGVTVETFALTHPHPDGVLGFRFDFPPSSTRNATSLAYVTDTVGDELYFDQIRGLDVLIHERNFANALHEVAVFTGHCSSQDVAKVAREVHPRQLILTHFNPVPSGDPSLEDDFLREFPDAIFASDRQIVEF